METVIAPNDRKLSERARRPAEGPPMPDTDPLQLEIGSAGRAPLQGDAPGDRGTRVLKPNPDGGLCRGRAPAACRAACAVMPRA